MKLMLKELPYTFQVITFKSNLVKIPSIAQTMAVGRLI